MLILSTLCLQSRIMPADRTEDGQVNSRCTPVSKPPQGGVRSRSLITDDGLRLLTRVLCSGGIVITCNVAGQMRDVQ